MANKYTFVWKGSVEKNKVKLEARVDAVLKAAESVLAKENAECASEEPCVEDLPERTERILRKMDEQGISDRKLRRSVEKVQIATENQFITNYGIYWRPTDWGTMIPFLDSFRRDTGVRAMRWWRTPATATKRTMRIWRTTG